MTADTLTRALLLLLLLRAAAAAAVPGFTVSGTRILDANGQAFMMRGVSHEHTWFKDDIKGAITSIAATGANTVRIVLSNGGQWTKDNLDSVQNILSLCESHKLIAMLEVHDATGSDSQQTLENAVDYWKELRDLLIGKEDRVIINIANEWFGTWETSGWADGYKVVIPELRNAGLEHLLVVDTAGYGQYPQAIFEKGKEVFQTDLLARTVFSIHMYEYAATDVTMIKGNIDSALNTGIPVIIGEFGDPQPESQPVDVGTIMSYTREKSVGWLAWSWYGNNDPILDMTKGPSGDYSLTDVGSQIVDSENGIRKTSTICSIFN
ncbi:hypothetical protein ABEB36_015728 [Hypothenemus hampei]|uniref:Glycoside hydrolase family 5 domain-containing protein n=1 Tax=Hypothenemus hampei TaxID=57062 RepID=A0ABD1DYY9_HYPHA